MKKSKLAHVALLSLVKVFNMRPISEEQNTTDLESIKGDGVLSGDQMTPLELTPILDETGKETESFEIIQGHRRNGFLQNWAANDPIGFKKRFPKGVPAYVWTDLSPADKESLRNDHGNVLNIKRASFIFGLVREAKANINSGAVFAADKLKEAWRDVQSRIIPKHWNNFLAYSGADQKLIRAYEDKLQSVPSFPAPASDAGIAATTAYEKRLAVFEKDKASEARELLCNLSRGFWDKVVRLAELPPIVLALYEARMNEIVNGDIPAFLAEKGIAIPTYHVGDKFPDVAGKSGAGSTTVINALHKAFVADGKTEGETYAAKWRELSTATKETTETGKQPKAMTGEKLGELAVAVKSEGLKAVLTRVRGLSDNLIAVNSVDAILTGVDAIGGKTLAELVKGNEGKTLRGLLEESGKAASVAASAPAA